MQPKPTVTLTREHRNAIRDHIHGYLNEAGDLELMSAAAIHGEDVRAMLDRLSVSADVLDQLGRERHGTADTYTLELDPEIVVLLDRIDRSARGTIEGNRDWLSPRNPGSPYTLEQYAQSALLARQMIDVDLDAIDAARLVREALATKCAAGEPHLTRRACGSPGLPPPTEVIDRTVTCRSPRTSFLVTPDRKPPQPWASRPLRKS